MPDPVVRIGQGVDVHPYHTDPRRRLVLGGVHIVRVHAVREMVQVVRVAEEIRRYHA